MKTGAAEQKRSKQFWQNNWRPKTNTKVSLQKLGQDGKSEKQQAVSVLKVH